MTKVERLIGNRPAIGIRPTIDGRRKGVRESLEEKTMTMAQSVATLLESSLYDNHGESVRVVIADQCIGGVAEAAEAKAKFAQESVGLTITVTPCWCYGSETMDMDPVKPNAIWGFNGTERPGAVYLAAVLAAHNQKGIPAFGIYGRDVQDIEDETIPVDVQEKLLRFAKAGLTVAMMRDQSYLSMGSVSMGIAGSMIDEDFFQDYLGMRNEYVDMTEILRRVQEEIYDPDEFERACLWVKDNCHIGADRNPKSRARSDQEKEEDLKMSIKMAMITRDLMVGNEKLADLGYKEEATGRNAIASGFQGQRQWTDFLPNGDFMEAFLNSSFDWNGIRAPYIVATENDSLNAVTMLFGHLLTNTAQIFADVRTYWSPSAIKRVTGENLEGKARHGVIHLINSGAAALDGTGEQEIGGTPAMKPFWQITEDEVTKCLDATSFRPANTEYFRGGGFSSNFLTKGNMPVTIARLNLVKGLGPVLQLAEGYTVTLPKHVHQLLDERTDPTWPTTWFVPTLTGEGAFKDVYSVMNHWGANHCVVSYGHIGADLITLASMLRIPVNMHNISNEAIFRPSAWSMFGSYDLEGADYRACSNYGPLYR
ncbi:L-fucose isomerase [Halalkalibacter sp. APA_J-10(15)]|uniref:L-fucose isomerase n=1 Tax=Halalkalibacter sp. APA_J-10(15) TaxID=2933805 RepID=UPI001FF2BAE1|nr:L-fucose isomerase [Halalkalibacter sp. APA_J-10(15)]MCK0470495.1 L-fucose isomerase [Halalkalibacter sp. APA_J-10(15)]